MCVLIFYVCVVERYIENNISYNYDYINNDSSGSRDKGDCYFSVFIYFLRRVSEYFF